MGVVLGLDFGEKRIGVAISDALEVTATPHLTLVFKSIKKAVSDIYEICQKHQVQKIVIGRPRHLNGEIGNLKNLNNFKNALEKTIKVPVIFEDESLTTQAAEKRLRARHLSSKEVKNLLDQEAAAIILDSYFKRN